MHCSLVSHTLWMTTAVLLQCFPGFILMNERMLQQLVCRWSKALVTGDKAKNNSFQMLINAQWAILMVSLEISRWILPCQTDVNKVLGLIGELPRQRGHFPSLCPNVEQGGYLIHVRQWWFPSGHLKHCAAHTPYVWLPAISCVFDDLSGMDESEKLTASGKYSQRMEQSCLYLWGHPIWSPVDRLDHISAVARRVIGAAETAGAAKVYELDDPSWH